MGHIDDSIILGKQRFRHVRIRGLVVIFGLVACWFLEKPSSAAVPFLTSVFGASLVSLLEVAVGASLGPVPAIRATII